jgi:inosine-uridine nucleoside N-ribohydrolase
MRSLNRTDGFCIALLAGWLLMPAAVARAAPAKIPVLLDTDIGDDIDDAFALALVLASPELDLRGVTTVNGPTQLRAQIVCRLLWAVGRKDLPVAAGRSAPAKPDIQSQMQYGSRPVYNPPIRKPAVEFLYEQLRAHKGEFTLLAIGPLTNIAQLIDKHPDCKPWIKRIVLMGGAVKVGYSGKPPVEAEYNVKTDIKAAQTVFRAGVPLLVVPLDATTDLKVDDTALRKLFAPATPLTNQLRALYQLWDKPTPVLFDPVAVALCFKEKFCTLEDLRLEVDDKGFTRVVKGKPNARVATSIRRDEFLTWCLDRLAAGKPAPRPTRPTNVSSLVPRGNMPYRIHVIEDYETDIERRWWLCGKLETKNVPPGSTRACRGVLTIDFDDLQGNMKAIYNAVIFNPVPGPPMGKQTRLSFRYWLKGTGNLRVQIYSLSKGYHRHLTLTDLPQGKWQAAAVDLTKARRPDGSGGPLSEDERIDDIQFYTDPNAELIIDDIVLYDAALADEKRLFPRRPLFTAWFDTGRQGQEWPGDFAIVPHEKPLTWKAAKSVLNKKTATPWIRLHLRGERPLGETTHLRFRYKLTGADSIRVVLVNRAAKKEYSVELKGVAKGRWDEMTVDFSDSKPRKGNRVGEVRFLLPKGAELLVDDVLLYEPGSEREH